MARNQETVFPISFHIFAVQVHVTMKEKFIKTAGVAYIPQLHTNQKF